MALCGLSEARGVTHTTEEVAAFSHRLGLRSAYFSSSKTQQASSPAAIAHPIASDGRINGHHQWLSKVDGDQPVSGIRTCVREASSALDEEARSAEAMIGKQRRCCSDRYTTPSLRSRNR